MAPNPSNGSNLEQLALKGLISVCRWQQGHSRPSRSRALISLSPDTSEYTCCVARVGKRRENQSHVGYAAKLHFLSRRANDTCVDNGVTSLEGGSSFHIR